MKIVHHWRVVCSRCGHTDGSEHKKLGDAVRQAKAIAKCQGCGHEQHPAEQGGEGKS